MTPHFDKPGAERVSVESLIHVMALRSIVIFALIAGLWVGKSKLGIGLPIEPILLAMVKMVSTLRERERRLASVREDHDIDYAHESRIKDNNGALQDAIEEMHFHPVEQRAARLTLTATF